MIEKEKKELSDNDFMELDEDFIVLAVPSDAVEIDITATIFTDGELKHVTKHMDFREIREAFKEANEGYIPSNALFSLVPIGEDKITDLVRKYRNGIEEESSEE